VYDREKASAIIKKISDARLRGKRPKLTHAEALIIEKYLDEQHYGGKYVQEETETERKL